MPTPMPFPQPSPPLTGGLPVGAICAYAGLVHDVSDEKSRILATDEPRDAAPTHAEVDYAPAQSVEAQGWMVCDGRVLEVAAYPELFAAIGYLYGGGEGAFRIPDLRGVFLRGVDAGAGVDPDAAWRTAPGGSGTGAGVGSLQHDALQDHVHSAAGGGAAGGGAAGGGAAGGGAAGGGAAGGSAPGGEAAASGHPAEPGSIDGERPDGLPARVSSETRPTNVAVHYLIKFVGGPGVSRA